MKRHTRPKGKGRDGNQAAYSKSTEPAKDHQTVAKLRSKIRDLTRLLQRSENMPADVKIEKERALAGYQADLEKVQGLKRKSDMIRRYHMVRFVERVKATRILKQSKKLLSTCPPTSTAPQRVALEAAIRRLEVDINYTKYYPLAEKYVSLYPRTAKDDAETAKDCEPTGGDMTVVVGGEKPPLWSVVENAMEMGTLDDLRDGSGCYAASRDNVKQPKSRKPSGSEKSAMKDHLREDKAANVKTVYEETEEASEKEKMPRLDLLGKEDDGSSDGGFFEE